MKYNKLKNQENTKDIQTRLAAANKEVSDVLKKYKVMLDIRKEFILVPLPDGTEEPQEEKKDKE